MIVDPKGIERRIGFAPLACPAPASTVSLPAAPRSKPVRTVSDFDLDVEGALQEQADLAAQSQKALGRWNPGISPVVRSGLVATE